MKRNVRRLLFALLATTVGCVGGSAADPSGGQVGHLQLPLTTVADDGQTYVLADATFDCTGPTTRSLVASDDGADVSADMPQGLYHVTLRDGWQLKRRADDGSLTAVEAVLASHNPLDVRVLPRSPSVVAFGFLLGSDQGSLQIHFGVSAHQLTIAGQLVVATDEVIQVGASTPFLGLLGTSIDYELRFAPGEQHIDSVDPSGAPSRTYLSGATHLVIGTERDSAAMQQLIGVLQGGTSRIKLERLLGDHVFMSVELSAYFPASGTNPEGYYRFKAASLEIEPHFEADGTPTLPPAGYTFHDYEPGIGFSRDRVNPTSHLPERAADAEGTGDLQLRIE